MQKTEEILNGKVHFLCTDTLILHNPPKYVIEKEDFCLSFCCFIQKIFISKDLIISTDYAKEPNSTPLVEFLGV